MSRKSILILLFLIVLVSFQYPRFTQNEVRASDGYPVHNLNTGLDYTTIHEAILANETLDGHVIHVDAGTYNVNYTTYNLINKSVSLLGDGRENTTLTATEPVPIFDVASDYVNISGFTMRNGTCGVSADVNYVHIMNCNVSGNGVGISMRYSGYPGHQLVGEIVEGNIVMNNSNGGIGLWTNNSIIRHNLISGNGGAGLVLAPGMSLEELATGNLVYENTIENNGQGKEVGLLIGGYNNTIFLNNFLNNVNFQNNQAESPFGTNAWDGRLNPDDLLVKGNFWSDYNGTDSNHDGIGDTPYIIDENNTDRYPLMAQYVIPEFPSFIVLPLFMIGALLAIVIYKRRHLTGT